jgi:Holliday junction resolvase RusA-like endonuclease
MTKFEWVLEPISKKHDRFDCTEPDLNNYLKKFARQNAQN